ncbi:MAG: DMT family transporter [Desulfovibrio sp.]|jgi:drug/metabolite transporter (DMT)-like permease|nr:DMT family transporter [Desulfovibrio sp.]
MKLPSSPSAKGFAFVLAGAAIISAAPFFVRVVDAGPSMIASYRLLWGSLALLGIALYRSERILPSRDMASVILWSSIFFSLDLISWHQSILYVGPGLATILTNFQVFFLAAYGSFFLKEALGLRRMLSIPLVLAGLWLLLDIRIHEFSPDIGFGLAAGLLSALMYTGFILTLRRSQTSCDRLSPTANMGVISLCAAVFTCIGGIAGGEDLMIHGLDNNLLMAVCGIGVHALGWVLLSKGLPLLPAAQGGLLLMFQPLLSFAWDVILFDRPTSLTGYLGATLALGAIAMSVPGSSASDKKKKTKL